MECLGSWHDWAGGLPSSSWHLRPSILVPDLPSPTTSHVVQADQTDLLGELTVGGARAQSTRCCRETRTQSTPELWGGPEGLSFWERVRPWCVICWNKMALGYSGFRVDGTDLKMSFRWGFIQTTSWGLCHLLSIHSLYVFFIFFWVNWSHL